MAAKNTGSNKSKSTALSTKPLNLTARSEQPKRQSKLVRRVASASRAKSKLKKIVVKNEADRKVGNAADRKRVSQANEERYQAKLKKVKSDIEKKVFKKFTVTKAKEYGLHNQRFADAKRDLKKQGYLVKKGQSYFAKTAVALAA